MSIYSIFLLSINHAWKGSAVSNFDLAFHPSVLSTYLHPLGSPILGTCPFFEAPLQSHLLHLSSTQPPAPCIPAPLLLHLLCASQTWPAPFLLQHNCLHFVRGSRPLRELLDLLLFGLPPHPYSYPHILQTCLQGAKDLFVDLTCWTENKQHCFQKNLFKM